MVLAGSCVPVDPCVASGESALHEMVSLDPALSGRHLGTGLLNHWLGVFLDPSDDALVDWDEIAEILEDAFRLVAPASAVAQLDYR